MNILSAPNHLDVSVTLINTCRSVYGCVIEFITSLTRSVIPYVTIIIMRGMMFSSNLHFYENESTCCYNVWADLGLLLSRKDRIYKRSLIFVGVCWVIILKMKRLVWTHKNGIVISYIFWSYINQRIEVIFFEKSRIYLPPMRWLGFQLSPKDYARDICYVKISHRGQVLTNDN